MSPNVTGWLLVLALWPWPHDGPSPRCADGTAAVLEGAERAGLAGEFATAAELLHERRAADPGCAEVLTAARAWDGWIAAVSAAAR
ncbi:MAG: hypothetical protein IT181_06925, partial [Acidobacteria bacterium]|nr:hypothetical protein [Acidobacteriota bacterium]